MNLKKLVITVLILSMSVIYFGCSTAKEEKDIPVKKEEKVPPGHARIVGEIVKIEPVTKSDDPNDPCSKAPCVAMVKVTGAEYGAGFPTLNMNEDIKIKFQFTLVPTSKDLFPNMEEKYPGLMEEQEFTALVQHIETINETIPNYLIYGYSTK